MGDYEPNTGASDEWMTPPDIFAPINIEFDVDPCGPISTDFYHVPAGRWFTKEENGLVQRWWGLVFMNPPYGRRYGHLPWLTKFLDHGNGIAILRAYTSSDWWHAYVWPRSETLLFPKGKTKFIRGEAMTDHDGTVHEAGSLGKQPGHGVVLIGMGAVANEALRKSGLGAFVNLRG